MDPTGQVVLTLVQPLARRREWELRRGDDVVALLKIPVFRSGAVAEAAGRTLRIERHGRIRPEYIVHGEEAGAEIARLRREGRLELLELSERTGAWKRLGRMEGFGFVDDGGEPFLRAKVRSDLLHSSGEVTLDAQLSETEALASALLAVYLLIRRNDRAANAAGATGAATAP
jgi:hypothetical protein